MDIYIYFFIVTGLLHSTNRKEKKKSYFQLLSDRPFTPKENIPPRDLPAGRCGRRRPFSLGKDDSFSRRRGSRRVFSPSFLLFLFSIIIRKALARNPISLAEREQEPSHWRWYLFPPQCLKLAHLAIVRLVITTGLAVIWMASGQHSDNRPSSGFMVDNRLQCEGVNALAGGRNYRAIVSNPSFLLIVSGSDGKLPS